MIIVANESPGKAVEQKMLTFPSTRGEIHNFMFPLTLPLEWSHKTMCSSGYPSICPHNTSIKENAFMLSDDTQ